MITESKSERFKRVAERRTIAVLRDLRVIGNCGNKANYSYTPDQVRKIFTEIETSVKESKNKFHIVKGNDFKL